VVFASNRGENPEHLKLYYIEIESKEITPIETGFDVNLFPQWSPDGNKILFTIPGIWNMYSINADGSELTQLTDFRSNNGDWAPDGQQLVFQSDHKDEPENMPDIYTMAVSGENLAEIVNLTEALDFAPRWSPVGEEILFISSRTGNLELFTMKTDGSDVFQVTDSKAPVYGGAWSPDGERIAFVYGQGAPSTDLYIINKDGDVGSVVRLTGDPAHDDSPSWSPDGTQLVYQSDQSGNNDLWIINTDGNDPIQLTSDEYNDHYPDWSP